MGQSPDWLKQWFEQISANIPSQTTGLIFLTLTQYMLSWAEKAIQVKVTDKGCEYIPVYF